MDYTTLGRTGLRVSVAGLGCGGFSRLGQSAGKSEDESVAIVRLAIEHGVTLVDTAANYGTEAIVGKALRGVPRDGVVVATKSSIASEGQTWPVERITASLDNSLRVLGVDCIDVFQLHGVQPSLYDHALNVVAPALLRERERGKFRFLGITETSPADPSHAMLARACEDGVWDVVMVAHHLLHRTAAETVFPLAQRHRIGTLLMFAVRSIFARPAQLREVVRQLAAEGRVDGAFADEPDPLGFLVHPGGAESLTDAAYRFARHEPGVDVVLFGTGDADHLRANIASLLRPPLPQADLARLREVFARVSGVGLDRPPPSRSRAA